MSYIYEKLPSEAILVLTYNADYQVKSEGLPSIEEGVRLLNAEEKPVFLIIDLLKIPSLRMYDIVEGASMATRQTQLLTHPKNRENLLITQSKLYSMVAKGLDSFAFGNAKLKTFDTVDEALAYARQAS